MSLKIICPHCRKPLDGEGVEKDAVCPHCGKPLSAPPEHSPEEADPAGTSTTVSSASDRFERIARLVRRYGPVPWLGIVLVSLVAARLDQQLSGPLIVGISAGLIITCVCLMRPGKRFRRLGLCVLVAGALVFLAVAIVSPLLFRYSEPCPQTDALGDCRNISTAIGLFHKDTGSWPIYVSADHTPESRVDYLYGNMGEMPEFSDEARESWGSRAEDMYFTLVTNGRTSPWWRYGRKVEGNPYSRPSAGGWAGPYLPYVTDNRQGYAYIVSVSGFEGDTKPDNHVWCLSAGVNGIVDTPAWAAATRGDDVGYRHE
ncbi:MAG: hypothetical protein JW759_07690 [Candidatus Coatesbacteria bacterium]|nr:hypothetical protein [Candidatus Coatesbacteria bacterium]